MSDPLAQSLPWMDLARKLVPVGRYLAAKWRFERRISEQAAEEQLRRGRILAAQLCLLHGHPQDTWQLQAAQPLWCGCEWMRDVIRPIGGRPQRVIRVSRLDPATGIRLVVSWADTGSEPSEKILNQAREALKLPSPERPFASLDGDLHHP